MPVALWKFVNRAIASVRSHLRVVTRRLEPVRPPPPQASNQPQISLARRVRQLMYSPHVGAREMAQLVSEIPRLRERVLVCINSPFYGMREPIHDVAHAISFIGFETLRQLAEHIDDEHFDPSLLGPPGPHEARALDEDGVPFSAELEAPSPRAAQVLPVRRKASTPVEPQVPAVADLAFADTIPPGFIQAGPSPVEPYAMSHNDSRFEALDTGFDPIEEDFFAREFDLVDDFSDLDWSMELDDAA